MRDLDHAQARLARSARHLSSGLRVDNASDDAAGLAISERMLGQVRGMDQAARNANDCISMVQQLDGFASQYSAGLQRVREMAVQATNGTNTAKDRLALDRQVQQALQELDRTAASQTFNGKFLADGSGGNPSIQVGANAGDSVQVNLATSFKRADMGALQTLTSADLRSIGAFTFDNTYTTAPIVVTDFSQVDRPLIAGQTTTAAISVTNYSGAAEVDLGIDGQSVVLNANYGSVAGVANAVQTQLDVLVSGAYVVSASGSTLVFKKTAGASSPASAVTITAAGGTNAAQYTSGTQTTGQTATTSTKAGFSVDGFTVSLTANYAGNVGALIADIQAQLNAKTGVPPVYAVSGDASGISFVKTGDIVAPTVSGFSGIGASVFGPAAAATLTLAPGDFSVQLAGGPAVAVTGSFATAQALAAAVNATGLDLYASIDPNTGAMEITSTLAITLAGGQAGGTFGFASLNSSATGSLQNASVLDAKNARTTILRIDATLNAVGNARSGFGATQNRMQSMINSLRMAVQQTASARGRIVDADYAGETEQLVRSKVLQQAGNALLAQAHADSWLVLRLLR